MLVASGVSLPVSHAQTPTPSPEAEVADVESGLIELVVAPESAVLSNSDSEAKFRVLIRNTGEATAPEGSVELRLGERITGASARLAPEPAADPATDPATDSATDTTPTTDPAHTRIATVQVEAIPGGKEQSATVTVPLTDMPQLVDTSHGVYPLYASYVASDSSSETRLTAFSPLVWGGPARADAALDLTSIVPLVLPANVQSMPSRAQLSDAVPGLTALVDFAASSQSVLAIDPRIITAIRGYGTEAPREASELLARLETGAVPSFLLQFGDADPAAQAAAGLDTLLQPAGFEFITRFGAWEVVEPAEPTDPTEPTDPAASSEPGGGEPGGGEPAEDKRAGDEPVDADAAGAEPAGAKSADDAKTGAEDPQAPGSGLDAETAETAEEPLPPTAEELMAWPRGLAAGWPAPGQADGKTLTLLRDAGYDLAVLNSDNVRLEGGPRAALGKGSALVTDAELDAAVRLALSGSTDTERALGEAQAAARLALAADAGVAGLILGVDRGAVASMERPEEQLSKLMDRRWVTHVAHGAQREGVARLIPAEPGEDRVELLAAAFENEPTVLEARSVLVNPEYLDGYQRMRLLTLFGTRGAHPDTDFEAAASRFAKRDAELHDGVRLVDTKRAQLVGGSTRIPIQVRNSLPFDALVTLEVAPTSAALLLPEREFRDIELPEDSSERVLVPVKSRVSSGESALLLSVTSPDGEYTASTGRLEVAISTTVETVAIAILASSAALLFGFGIWRSVRRRKSLSTRE
ncbi:hypothetical protein ACI1US_01996 [Leucobacter sp. BZR 635]